MSAESRCPNCQQPLLDTAGGPPERCPFCGEALAARLAQPQANPEAVVRRVLALGGAALLGSLFGFAYMIVGPIVLRVYCEVLIIFFRMYETMKEVRDGIERMRKE